MNVDLEIKFEAQRQGVELQELAKRLGTYPEKLSRAFSGERPLSTSLALDAAQALNIPLSELVRRAEEAQHPTRKETA